MILQGHGGKIINMASQAGRRGESLVLVYCSSKAAVISMTQGVKRSEVEANVPAGRFAVPEDLTGMAIFLASSDSDYILSQTYNVDGGQWMS